jgi:hypothetical protein
MYPCTRLVRCLTSSPTYALGVSYRYQIDPTGSPGRTGNISPANGARGYPPAPQALKRKLTLLQLIDELSALREDDGMQGGFFVNPTY